MHQLNFNSDFGLQLECIINFDGEFDGKKFLKKIVSMDMDKPEKFLAEHTLDGGLFQSDFWSEFHQNLKHKTLTLGDDENFRALLIEHQLPLVGKYFFVPRGPVIGKSHQIAEKYLANLFKKAKFLGAGWVRLEPQAEADLRLIEKVISRKKSNYKIVKARKDHQPKQTLITDLEKPEAELLAQMKAKTRYNIRLARRKKVEIFESKGEDDLRAFLNLMHQTAQRDKIVNHPDEHYAKLLKTEGGKVKLFLARHQDQIIAGALVGFYGEVATYLHGASGNRRRNVMAPFLLHWEIMKTAKRQGMKKYDWGGTKLTTVTIDGAEKIVPAAGNWQGISRFKLGFSPQTAPLDFPGCYDVIIQRGRYQAYRWLQKIKDRLRKIRK